MYKVLILPLAKIDVKEAADWYNSRQEGLGKKFIFTPILTQQTPL